MKLSVVLWRGLFLSIAAYVVWQLVASWSVNRQDEQARLAEERRARTAFEAEVNRIEEAYPNSSDWEESLSSLPGVRHLFPFTSDLQQILAPGSVAAIRVRIEDVSRNSDGSFLIRARENTPEIVTIVRCPAEVVTNSGLAGPGRRKPGDPMSILAIRISEVVMDESPEDSTFPGSLVTGDCVAIAW